MEGVSIPKVSVVEGAENLGRLRDALLKSTQDDERLRAYWADSERKEEEKRRLKLREEWRGHHLELSKTFSALAEEHASLAAALEEGTA